MSAPRDDRRPDNRLDPQAGTPPTQDAAAERAVDAREHADRVNDDPGNPSGEDS